MECPDITDLPYEILNIITKDLSYTDVVNLSMTCKHFYNVLYDIIKIKQEYISWKVVVHLIKTHNSYRVDKSWIKLGTANSYTDFISNEWEYCSDCEEANCVNKYSNYIMHGEDTVQSSDILTLIKKGIGGKFLEEILNKSIDNYVPLSISIEQNLLINFKIKINEKTDIMSYANLKVNSLCNTFYKTDEIQEYPLIGLYLDPNGRNPNSPYEVEFSSDDLGDYDYYRYMNDDESEDIDSYEFMF